MAEFETKVCLVNKYGEVVCELEEDVWFYKFPMDFAKDPSLNIIDKYKVMEIEMEVEWWLST